MSRPFCNSFRNSCTYRLHVQNMTHLVASGQWKMGGAYILGMPSWRDRRKDQAASDNEATTDIV